MNRLLKPEFVSTLPTNKLGWQKVLIRDITGKAYILDKHQVIPAGATIVYSGPIWFGLRHIYILHKMGFARYLVGSEVEFVPDKAREMTGSYSMHNQIWVQLNLALLLVMTFLWSLILSGM